jgi:nucleotide-binding universal stress UspA family protein
MTTTDTPARTSTVAGFTWDGDIDGAVWRYLDLTPLVATDPDGALVLPAKGGDLRVPVGGEIEISVTVKDSTATGMSADPMWEAKRPGWIPDPDDGTGETCYVLHVEDAVRIRDEAVAVLRTAVDSAVAELAELATVLHPNPKAGRVLDVATKLRKATEPAS